MPDFIHELIIMIIATLLVFIIVALRDRITIQRYYNTFQITPSIKLFYEWGYYVALDLAWLRWNVSITLYDRPFSYTEDELNEFKEWDTTLEDGLETEPWWGGNNDNPDETTTGKTNTTTNITDETDN
jgi:hypothetical protein